MGEKVGRGGGLGIEDDGGDGETMGDEEESR